MENQTEIQKQIKALFASQSLAMLATQNLDQPYASLVAFANADDLRQIFFVTPKTTRKFANLTATPNVALLINSALNQVEDFHRAIAVTAVGKAEEITGNERDRTLPIYLAKHPHLEEFAMSPTCALVRVTVKSYYLVQTFQNVTEFHFKQ